MDKFRIAIVGAGGISKAHAAAIIAHPEAEIAAVCDIDREAAERRAGEWGVPAYTDLGKMFKREAPEAAVIGTPHPTHPEIAAACAAAGVHILTEKPMASRVSDADRMIAAARAAGVTLAVVFQRRFWPVYTRAAELLAGSAMGPLVRTHLVSLSPRTTTYYRSGTWRATWSGEGGGVLLNQAPHALDVLVWLGGQPAAVLGRLASCGHPIEVEDRADAVLAYAGGAAGFLHASTVEYPPAERVTVSADLGRVEVDGNTLRIARLERSTRDHIRNSPEMWGQLAAERSEERLPAERHPGGVHGAVIEDFAAAVRERRAPAVPGEEGRKSLELANAITLSHFLGREVELPLDREAYDHLLAFLQRRAKGRRIERVRYAPPGSRRPETKGSKPRKRPARGKKGKADKRTRTAAPRRGKPGARKRKR